MNFETIRSRIGNYETSENGSAVSEQMQKLIAKNGFDVFHDIPLLSEEIRQLDLPQTAKAQLVLVFSCSTLPEFIANAKSDLNMVDVDNAVHSVVDATGLSYRCAITLIADIFYACGLRFAIEYGPQWRNDSVEYALHAMMPAEMVAREVRKATELYERYQADFGKEGSDQSNGMTEASKVIDAIHALCAAGIADGFYLLARCYLYGECGTAADKEKAMQLMKIAAEQGHARASACLGDLYYQEDRVLERDYTLAHHYYTRPGSLAMGKPQQEALQDIERQHRANKTTLTFSGILLACMIVFVAFFHNGLFTGSSRLALGIVATVLSGLAVAATAVYHIRKPFNGIRWVLMVQFFLWGIYSFLLVLA